ncbi:MAG TPA: DUF6158 family protein [Jatrophihabitans sp.]|jgi:hypothetical protein
MSEGVPARALSDDELRHELLQLKVKQGDIHDEGTPQQRSNHARRTAELEEEFLARFGSEAEGEGSG